mmetsp:Transcript_22575/g.52579  ORF Transcript_22575/g.52579 Transcript_22575/m.52579 type:complete len:366 (+) Transcript_22575:119-1216(+)
MDAPPALDVKLLSSSSACPDVELGLGGQDTESDHGTLAPPQMVIDGCHKTEAPDAGQLACLEAESSYHRAEEAGALCVIPEDEETGRRAEARQPLFTDADYAHPEKFCFKLVVVTCCFPCVFTCMACEKMERACDWLTVQIQVFCVAMAELCEQMWRAIDSCCQAIGCMWERLTWPVRILWAYISPCCNKACMLVYNAVLWFEGIIWKGLLATWNCMKPCVDAAVHCCVVGWQCVGMCVEAVVLFIGTVFLVCCDAVSSCVSWVCYWPTKLCKVVEQCAIWAVQVSRDCIRACCQPLVWAGQAFWSRILKPSLTLALDSVKVILRAAKATWSTVYTPLAAMTKAIASTAADVARQIAQSIGSAFH